MTNTTNQSSAAAPRFDASAGALWASFVLVLALVIVQASRLGSGNPAYAGELGTVGQMTALTVAGGPNEEVLMLLDKREELILVYGIQGGRSVQLLQVEELGALFNQARSAAGGGTKR